MIVRLLQIELAQHPEFSDLIRLSKHLLAISTESNICLPLMKAFCELEIIFPNIDFSLFAKTLEIILYTPPAKLIGQTSLTSTAPTFFGIRETSVGCQMNRTRVNRSGMSLNWLRKHETKVYSE